MCSYCSTSILINVMHRFIWEGGKIWLNTILLSISLVFSFFVPFFHLSTSSPLIFSQLFTFWIYLSRFPTTFSHSFVSYPMFLYLYNPFSFHQILFSLCPISLSSNYLLSYPILQPTCLLLYYYFHLFINVNGNLFTWLAY